MSAFDIGVATMAITINQQVVGRTTSPQFRPAYSPNRQKEEPQIEFVGVPRRKVYANQDGFKIIKLEDNTTIKVTDLHNQITMGITYRFSGVWKESRDPRYPGKDFYAKNFTLDKPTSERGIVGFLSKMCKHIGPFTARQIFDKFGEISVEVVRREPEKIAAAGFLDMIKAREAAECLQSQDGMERTKIELHEIMQGHGFSSLAIEKCIKIWGSNAPQVIRHDPFKLMVAHIRSAGFARCDKLYHSLGLSPTRLKRQMLAVWYALRTNREGHTWLSAKSLGLLNERAIKLGLRSKWIAQRIDTAGGRWLAEGGRAKDEQSIAKAIRKLMSWTPTHGVIGTPLWPAAANIEGLSDHQRATLGTVLTSTVTMLNGKPGTGKTYTVAKIVKHLLESFGEGSVSVCAPTGKAARRVQENLADNGVSIQARTIHSMFGLTVNEEEEDDVSGGADGGREELVVSQGVSPPPATSQFIIIDEVSMLDANVAARLLNKLPSGTHLLLVGDVNQLPPVGHGSPLRDILRSKAIPSGELTEIRRNSGLIVTACHQIAGGKAFQPAAKYNPETGDNLRLIPSLDDNDTVEGVVKVTRLLPGSGFDVVNDCQVIAALNVKGSCSKNKINLILQDVLNPTGKKEEGKTFRVRDKVIFTKNMDMIEVGLKNQSSGGGGGGGDNANYRESPNNYFNNGIKSRVANGDIGRVLAIDSKSTIVRFDAPQRVVRLTRDIECFLDLAYVVSCHKFQGSESPVVIVVLDPAAGSVCCREWVYTAISRAKKLCVLVGPEGLAQRFCKKVSLNNRKTFLAEELKCQAS